MTSAHLTDVPQPSGRRLAPVALALLLVLVGALLGDDRKRAQHAWASDTWAADTPLASHSEPRTHALVPSPTNSGQDETLGGAMLAKLHSQASEAVQQPVNSAFVPHLPPISARPQAPRAPPFLL